MGLAGRKEKQRIPNDPRNLAWSENAAKFGHTYLAKLGWSPELGLGVAKDGRTTNITVAQKLDQLGIGAGRGPGGNDKDAIAWKQQNDFEMMLARLNTPDGETPPPTKTGVVAALGFVSGNSDDAAAQLAQTPPDAEGEISNSKSKKDKKRKRSQLEAEVETSSASPAPVATTVLAVDNVPTAAAPRRFAHHRARLLHSKKITGKSAAHISEVLGVAPSTSSSSSASPAPGGTPGTLTPISDDKITTSTTSISDYFKEKMEKMKNKHKWMAEAPAAEPITPSAATNRRDEEDDEERPRFGLGARRADALLSATPSFAPSTNVSTPSSPFPIFASSSKSSPAPSPSSAAEDVSPASSSSQKLSPPPPDAAEVLDKAERKRRRKEAKAAAAASVATDMDVDPQVEKPVQPAAEAAEPSKDGKKKKRKVDTPVVEGSEDAEAEAKRKRKEEKKAKKRAKEQES